MSSPPAISERQSREHRPHRPASPGGRPRKLIRATFQSDVRRRWTAPTCESPPPPALADTRRTAAQKRSSVPRTTLSRSRCVPAAPTSHGMPLLSPPICDPMVISVRCNGGDTLEIVSVLFMSYAEFVQTLRTNR